jgi:AbrB family looped-hinge helix DNA binding protein
MTATITLDSAGRLVLPKAIREKMHLQAGSKLRADLVGEKLEISMDVPEATIVKRGKRRVITDWDGFDAAKAVREMRDAQVAKLDSTYKK